MNSYLGSKQHSDNLKKARLNISKKQCQYCYMFIKGSGNISKHEVSCFLHPKNIRLCKICQSPIKNKKSQTCSYSCSNKHFRIGPNNGNWKEDSYQTTCFHYHKKECIICGEKNIVTVHHLDENKNNNKPENLIPLCPTHHQYWHSRYKHLIEKQIYEYIKIWKGG